MTNKEALEILEHNWTKLVNPDCTEEELGQALELAIKALEERPQGDWRDNLIEVFRQSAEVGGDTFHLFEIERIINGEPI